MNALFRITWPSFLVAGVAETAFFAAVEPQSLFPAGQPALSPTAIYSLGFFFFWLTCSGSSLATRFLMRSATELNANSHANVAPPKRFTTSFGLHQQIHEANDAGSAWRIVSGVVRLDTPNGSDSDSVAGLALAGDVIGAETICSGRYAFRATALTPVVLAPWPGRGEEQPAQLQAVARGQNRAAKVLALRTGQALERVTRLVRLLAEASSDGKTALLPSLKDMSDITALTIETVSRSLSRLGRQGLLKSDEPRRGGGGGKKLSRITFIADPAT